MKKIILAIFLIATYLTAFCQGINSKAIEITNTDSEKYTHIEGTKLKIILPEGFSRRNASTFEHPLAQSYISVQELEGDVNRNLYTFDKKTMFQAGIVVMKETFFKINGYEAMMIDGEQYIDGKELAAMILIIGNVRQTYMILGTTPKPIQNNMNITLSTALLGIIFDPTLETSTKNLFSYSIDCSGTGLIEGKPMGDTRTFTDDGNVPSRTDNKTSLTIREIKSGRQYTDEQQKGICTHRFAQYPITWYENSDTLPHKFTSGKLSGYEIYASGTSKIMQEEFIYQLIIFTDDRYFAITGMTFGDEKECLEMFRKVAGTLKM